MTQFDQFFETIDKRFTERRAQLERFEGATSAFPEAMAVYKAMKEELLDQQIKFRTDRLMILSPQPVLGRAFFWKVKIKAFFYRWRGAPVCESPRGVCVIPRREGRFAVSRRTNTSGSGLWQFPGGSVEPGEDAAIAAIRELHEETGLLVKMNRLVPLPCPAPLAIGYKGERFERSAFGVELLPGEELASPEATKHTPWQWVTLEELRSLPMLTDTFELAQNWSSE